MKRLLIFSLAYHPRVGGAEVAIKEITDRIQDIEFHLITKRFSSDDPVFERLGNVEVYRVGGPTFLYPFVSFLKARQLHRQKKFDGAWAMMSYMVLPVVFLRMVGIRLPYILTLQEGDTYEHMFGRLHIKPFLPFIDSGFRHATVVQVISTFLGGWARTRGYQGDVVVVPNGVDTKKFAGEHVPQKGTTLITTSRLVRKNGIDTVIRALPHLPDIEFVVCGTGSDEHMLKVLAKDLGVAERVHWRGFVSHDEMPRHLHHADIFIRPSRSEGMGNSFVEAMAAGLPVIATQEGGLKDFINSDTAWVVCKDHPEDIVMAVQDILGNPEHTNRVIQTARDLAFTKYDWNLIAKDMREQVFARVL